MTRVVPCEEPRSCPGAKRSIPTTRRPRRASAAIAALPMTPRPMIATSKEGIGGPIFEDPRPGRGRRVNFEKITAPAGTSASTCLPAFRSAFKLLFGCLQGIRRRTGQSPANAGRGIVKVDLAVDAALRHCVDDRAAKAAMGWRGHRRTATLGPVHGEDVAVEPPPHRDRASLGRQRPILAGIAAEFVQRDPHGLPRPPTDAP